MMTIQNAHAMDERCSNSAESRFIATELIVWSMFPLPLLHGRLLETHRTVKTTRDLHNISPKVV